MRTLLLWVSSILTVTFSIDAPCKSRDYGFGSTVCVCDSTYCDTLTTPTKSDSDITFYTTSKSGLRFQQQNGIFSKGKPTNGIVKINGNVKYQEIIGWGGAFTDATGINILSLDPKAQDYLLESYFSKAGIEYNLGRVPIGGTDFSTRKYTYDDGDELDLDLVNFQLAPEDYKYKIPIIQRAHNLNKDLKLFGGAWYSPNWMRKDNNSYALPDFVYQSWSDYHLKFLEQYNVENIRFWALSTGNEPYIGFLGLGTVDFVSWLPKRQAKWIANNLGPTLRDSTFSDVKILLVDDQTIYLPFIPDLVLNNTIARNFVDGIAIHWYLNSELTPLQLKLTRDHFPEKFILSTEACNVLLGAPLQLGSWDNAEKYANDIIRDLKNYVTGWVDWNLALDLEGGPNYINNFVDSPIIVNSTSGEFYKQPMFYILGHFSKFVPAGSYRINISGNSDNYVEIVAFERPDASKAVILFNNANSSAPISLHDMKRGTFELNLEENSITTIIYS